MTFKKLPILLTILLAVGSIVLLSNSMRQLNLTEQGKAFRLPEITQSDPIVNNDSDSSGLDLDWSLGLFGGVIWRRIVSTVLVVATVASLLTKDGRRRFFSTLLFSVPFILMFYGFAIVWPAIESLIASLQAMLRGNSDAPILQFVSTIPPYIIVLTSLALAILVVAGGWGLTVLWQRRRVLSAVSAEATTALAELKSGAELRHVIIETYRAMGEAVSQTKGISRSKNTTPREYEERLVDAGLPSDAVERLTRLFELVRYGGQSLGEQSRTEAENCLQAIINACAGSREVGQ